MKEKKCGIYKVTNIVNAKVIIGQSTNIYHRWNDYRKYARNNNHWNYRFQDDWNQYGEDSFRFDIILECPRDKLNEEEVRLVKEYNSTNKDVGYNISSGGDHFEHSEETKQKIRLSKLGPKNPMYKKQFSKEHRQRISAANLGKRHSDESKLKISIGNIGKKFSEETKRKMSLSKKGILLSEEHKQKLKKARRGRIFSEETKRKMSASLKGKYTGEKSPNYGSRRSEESKRKMSEAQYKRFAISGGVWLGKHHSEETKRKMSASQKRRFQKT